MQAVYSGGIVLLCLCTIFLAGGTDSLSGVCDDITGSCMPCLEEQTNVESQIDGYEERYYMVRKDFEAIIPKIEVTEFSDLYPNKGTKKFYRAVCGSKKSNIAEKIERKKRRISSCVK